MLAEDHHCPLAGLVTTLRLIHEHQLLATTDNLSFLAGTQNLAEGEAHVVLAGIKIELEPLGDLLAGTGGHPPDLEGHLDPDVSRQGLDYKLNVRGALGAGSDGLGGRQAGKLTLELANLFRCQSHRIYTPKI